MKESHKEVDAMLDAIAGALGFKVESEDGWVFLKNCKEDGFADESRHIEFGKFHGIYCSKLELLKSFLDSKLVHVPIVYNDYGCQVYEMVQTANPFYGLDLYEAAVEASLMCEHKVK